MAFKEGLNRIVSCLTDIKMKNGEKKESNELSDILISTVKIMETGSGLFNNFLNLVVKQLLRM